MAFGLELYNAAGNLSLGISDRLPKYFGIYSGSIYSPADQTVYSKIFNTQIIIPEITADGTWEISPEFKVQMSHDGSPLAYPWTVNGYLIEGQVVFNSPEFVINAGRIDISWLACTSADGGTYHGVSVIMELTYNIIVYRY